MVRINAILPEDTIKKIDSIAKEEKKSRSGLLREAAEKLITEYQKFKAEQLRKERLVHAIETQNKLKKKAGKWDGVSEVRRWRELRK
ncbi:MAG TPA: ribbon-helix-helix protein, CopG family [Candidatus Brocadiaceae bacterium]